MSNLHTYYHFQLDFQKLDQHTGGKWYPRHQTPSYNTSEGRLRMDKTSICICRGLGCKFFFVILNFSYLCHMVILIWVHICSGNGVLPDGTKAITETNVD